MPKVNRKGTAAEIRERQARFDRYLAAGVPTGDAVRLALSADPHDRERTQRAIPDFAARHGINSKLAAAAIYGGRKPTDDLCTALAAELGQGADYWMQLLWPRASAVASA